ncbi:unnamed protein product, partial [marine sediment metagenome]
PAILSCLTVTGNVLKDKQLKSGSPGEEIPKRANCLNLTGL